MSKLRWTFKPGRNRDLSEKRAHVGTENGPQSFEKGRPILTNHRF
jgi:hypothetical protein